MTLGAKKLIMIMKTKKGEREVYLKRCLMQLTVTGFALSVFRPNSTWATSGSWKHYMQSPSGYSKQ